MEDGEDVEVVVFAAFRVEDLTVWPWEDSLRRNSTKRLEKDWASVMVATCRSNLRLEVDRA